MIEIAIANFLGGYSTTPLGDNEASELTNMVVKRDGTIHGRSGFAQVGSNTVAGSPIYIYKAILSSAQRTMCQTSTGLYYHDTTANTWNLIGAYAAGTNTLGKIIQFDDYALVCNSGYTGIVKYDGTTASYCSGSPSNVRCIETDNNYVYAVNTGNTIYYSEAGNQDSWPSDNVLYVGSDKDSIHDMVFLWGKLFIFKETSIWVKSGLDENDFTLEKVSNDGCFSRCAKAYNGIYFMGAQDLMQFNGSECKRFTAKLDTTTFTPATGEQFMYYSFQYRNLYVPTTTYLYVYDELMDAWSRFNIASIQAMSDVSSGNLYIGISGDTKVYRGWTGTTDAGTAISTTYKSRVNIDGGSPELLKRPKYVFLDAMLGTATTTLTGVTMKLLYNNGVSTDKTWTTPSRINYASQSGVPSRNFGFLVTGPQNLRLRGIKLEVQGVSI